MRTKRIILAGGNGFLGQILFRHFSSAGYTPVVLSRRPRPGQIFWDGNTIGEWARELEGAAALINLAGRSVNCRYHKANRRRILASRIDSTRVLGQAIQQCHQPPEVWLNSSTATIYRHTFDQPNDENGEIGATPEAKDGFSVEVALAWEHEFQRAETPRTRKVCLRSAMVLGPGSNSVFPVLHRLVRFGLGGTMGSGRQYVSWIHHHDFCRAIEWLIDHPDADGVFNLAAPNPIPNSEMMRVLRELTHRSVGLPATEAMLEIGAFFLRTETELIIKSRRVIPGRLSNSGFQFHFEHIRDAFQNLLQRASAPLPPAPKRFAEVSC